MKKLLLCASLFMLLSACGGNTSSSTSTSTSTTTSSATSEPVVETPNLAEAIEALGDSFVIHYTNTQQESDSMIYCTGKSVFIQADSSLTELSDYDFVWWVEITTSNGELAECTYESSAWCDFQEYENRSYEDTASNINNLDASLFTWEAENSVFNYSANLANAFDAVSMLASFNKKNDFLNLNFETIQIKLSEDNSVVKKISITAKTSGTSPEAVSIELEFSEYTALPFGLSDAEPIEAE